MSFSIIIAIVCLTSPKRKRVLKLLLTENTALWYPTKPSTWSPLFAEHSMPLTSPLKSPSHATSTESTEMISKPSRLVTIAVLVMMKPVSVLTGANASSWSLLTSHSI